LAEREIAYLQNIWPGEYDNVEQLDFDKYSDRKDPASGAHLRMHTFLRAVDLPQFGPNVFYQETYQNDDPNDIYKQHIYALSPMDNGHSILIKTFSFATTKATLGLDKELKLSKSLQPNSPQFEKGCEMILEREGMAFVGRTRDVACHKNPEHADQGIDFQIRISENEFWFRNQTRDLETNQLIEDPKALSWYQQVKSRCFACMIDFPREKGGRPVNTVHYIKIHDQGGKFEFDYTDGRHMVLGMRNTWSFGMQRETFVIFIQEENQKGKTLIYSWGNPGADRIGFNPGWIRVQCDLDTPKNNKLQQDLRPDS